MDHWPLFKGGDFAKRATFLDEELQTPKLLMITGLKTNFKSQEISNA
jgi:hypothetical protein